MNYDKPKVTIDLDEYLELKKAATENKRDNGALPLGTSISIKMPFDPMRMFYKVADIFVGETYVNYSLQGTMGNISMEIHSTPLAK